MNMAEPNSIDLALQTTTPTVMVPRYAPFEPMTTSGHRFLAANDGMWLELKRAWLHTVLPVALQHKVPMPYGWVKQSVNVQCGRIPSYVVMAFIADAERTPDTEIAASGIWNAADRTWRYERLEATESSGAHIRYLRPRIREGEHLVLDMHSHGMHPAFFSTADDEDDKGEVKLAMVLGRDPSTGARETCLRLCVLGMYMKVDPSDVVDEMEGVQHG